MAPIGEKLPQVSSQLNNTSQTSSRSSLMASISSLIPSMESCKLPMSSSACETLAWLEATYVCVERSNSEHAARTASVPPAERIRLLRSAIASRLAVICVLAAALKVLSSALAAANSAVRPKRV
jgi:hypothetical protein